MDDRLQHVAVIPDGNRRWSRRFWTRLKALIFRQIVDFGHRQGAEVFKDILKEALKLKISYVTIWACSPANLQRPEREVKLLYELLEQVFTELAQNDEIHKNRVKIRVIGRWQDDKLCPLEVQKAIKDCISATSQYDAYHLLILVAYSGLDERRDTEKRIREDPAGPQIIAGKEIVTEEYEKNMSWIGPVPDVDLIIRTGSWKDPHNSEAFMPYHTAYSQLNFPKVYWPAFTAKKFRKIIEDFNRRERRYGR